MKKLLIFILAVFSCSVYSQTGETKHRTAAGGLTPADIYWTKTSSVVHPKLNTDNVCIGSTTSSHKLYVVGTMGVTSDVILSGDVDIPKVKTNASSTSDTVLILDGEQVGKRYLNFTALGSALQWSDTTGNLVTDYDISDMVQFSDTGAIATNTDILWDTTADVIHQQNTSLNVAIGSTTTPYKLYVVGTMGVTQAATFNNTIATGSVSANGSVGFTATDGDAGSVSINTSDQLVFAGFSGGITGNSIGLTSHLYLPLENDAATPTLNFGDDADGFYSSADGVINVSTNGTSRGYFNDAGLTMTGAFSGATGSFSTSTTTPLIYSSSPLTLDVTGTGNSYVEIIQDNNAGYLAVGRTTATEYSMLSITDGGSDNLQGRLQLYNDGGSPLYWWVSTANVFRTATANPSDDDADGYAIIDIDNGDIGAADQDVYADYVYNSNRVHLFFYYGDSTISKAYTTDWAHLTNAINEMWIETEANGFTVSNDTITITAAGDYDFLATNTCDGDNGETVSIRFYNVTDGNGIPVASSATMRAAGNYYTITTSAYAAIDAGDKIVMQYKGSADGTSVFKNGTIKIYKIHE